MAERTCVICDGPLTGRQKLLCSKACSTKRLMQSDAYKRAKKKYRQRYPIRLPQERRTCAWCGEEFNAQITPNREQDRWFCSPEHFHKQRTADINAHQTEPRECFNCGKLFNPTPHIGSHIYCSRPCRRQASKAKRRAQKLAVEYEPVSRIKVFERDGYICGLCGKNTLPSKSAPHPRTPTLDHIVPLSKGGAHTYLNVQTACWKCNILKKDGPGGQLRLVG